MNIEHRDHKKKSLGSLTKATKTKPRSPDLTGQIAMQRHTFDVIAQQFAACDADEIKCNIAAWRNCSYQGQIFLSVELSPRYSCDMKGNFGDDVLGFLDNGNEELP